MEIRDPKYVEWFAEKFKHKWPWDKEKESMEEYVQKVIDSNRDFLSKIPEYLSNLKF